MGSRVMRKETSTMTKNKLIIIKKVNNKILVRCGLNFVKLFSQHGISCDNGVTQSSFSSVMVVKC